MSNHHLSTYCLSILLCCLLLSVEVSAQSHQEIDLPVVQILQYQQTKQKKHDHHAPFKRMGMHRIRAKSFLENDNSRMLWGYHVNANMEYDKDKQPLYQLFKRADLGSFVVIDHFDELQSPTELIFWGKKYYRKISSELRRMGFTFRNSKQLSNCLEFRKEGVSIAVDITIWPDIYLVKIYSQNSP